MQTSRQTSLDESKRVQTNVDKCRQRMQTSHQTNVDECKQMQTSVKESKKFFFDINGGFPKQIVFNLRRFLRQLQRRTKKFVSHCNRCTVVSRFLIQILCVYKRNEVAEEIFLCLNSQIFRLQTDLEEYPQQSKMVRKRGKTFN